MRVQLHVRHEVFEHALLPYASVTQITIPVLQRLALFTKASRHRTFPLLSFGDWSKWSADVLGLTPDVAWIYFETFDVISDVTDDRRLKFNEKEIQASTVEAVASLRDKSCVNIYEFMLFLYLQSCDKVSLKLAFMTGEAEWRPFVASPASPNSATTTSVSKQTTLQIPSSNLEPPAVKRAASPEFRRLSSPEQPLSQSRPASAEERPSYYARALSNETSRIAFIIKHLPDILQLLIDPDMYANTDAIVCRGGIEALGFVLNVERIESDSDVGCDPYAICINKLPLMSIIGTQPESQVAGFSKISNAFELSKLGRWIELHLKPDRTVSICASRPDTQPLLLQHTNSSAIAKLNKRTLIWDDSVAASSVLHLYNCNSSSIYLLAPFKHVHISDCRNCLIVLGSAQGALTLTRCRKVIVVAAARRINCSHSEDCTFYACTATAPILLDSAVNIKFGPHNTNYPKILVHFASSQLDPRLNKVLEPIITIPKGPHASNFTIIPPSEFHTIAIPIEQSGAPAPTAIALPSTYQDVISCQRDVVKSLQLVLASLDVSGLQKDLITETIETRFMEWLAETGHVRQLNDLTTASTATSVPSTIYHVATPDRSYSS